MILLVDHDFAIIFFTPFNFLGGMNFSKQLHNISDYVE